eukprot:1063410_1
MARRTCNRSYILFYLALLTIFMYYQDLSITIRPVTLIEDTQQYIFILAEPSSSPSRYPSDDPSNPPSETSREMSLDVAGNTTQDHFNKTLAFWHIPKTGGTSIENSAWKARNILWGLPLFIGNHKGSLGRRVSYLIREGVCRQTNHKYCPKQGTWHIPMQYIAQFLLNSNATTSEYRTIYDRYFNASYTDYFCVIRHPYQKLLSQYKWTLFLGKGGGRPKMYDAQWIVQQTNNVCSEEALNYYIKNIIQLIENNTINYCFENCHFVPQSEYVFDEENGNKQMCKHVIYLEDLSTKIGGLLEEYS